MGGMSYARGNHLGIAALELRQRAVERADPAVREIAQDLVNQGNTAFRAGDYDTAIRRYTDAWTLYPHPDVLLLIGVVMMRQGRYLDASYRFSRYLRENPDGNQRELAQTQLANAQAAIERQSGRVTDMDFVAEGAAPATPAPVPIASQIPPQVLQQARQTITTPQQAQQLAPPPTSIPNPYARRTSIAIWVATGAGVLGLVGFGVWAATRRRAAPVAVTANRRRRRRTSRR